MVKKEIVEKMFCCWQEIMIKKHKEEKATTHFYFCDCGANIKNFIYYLLHQIRHPSHHMYMSHINWFVVEW